MSFTSFGKLGIFLHPTSHDQLTACQQPKENQRLSPLDQRRPKDLDEEAKNTLR